METHHDEPRAGEMKLEVLMIRNRPARLFEGGTGSAVVLIHGGWAGAAAHWSAVWTELAQRHHVVAPDLPGVGDVSQPGLGSVGAYAGWLRDVLDARGVDRACLVGNSFGASVACRFAFDYPDRCTGLVLVNGFPMPPTPASSGGSVRLRSDGSS